MRSRVLIIGSNGYVGSSLYFFLKTVGFDVIGFGSRYDDYNRLLADTLQKYDTIILLAGNSSVASCAGDLKSPWNNNVRNFQNLIEKLLPDQKLIYASSSSVYGKQNLKLYTEDDVCLEYLNNYDLTKISLDLVAQRYQSLGGQVIGLRFGTVNGSGAIIRKDLMINSMVLSALNEKKIVVTNSHINRPILALRDLHAAIEKILTGQWNSGIYNLASFNATVSKIANTISRLTGVATEDQGPRGDPYDFRIDTSKFINTFDYRFKCSIDSIVWDLIECYTKQNPKLISRDTYFNYIG